MADPLKPSHLAGALRVCLAAGRAPMVHGDPGIGKSEVTRQVADAMFAEAYGCKVVDGVLCYGVKVTKVGKSPITQTEWIPVPANFNRPWFRDVRAALLDAVDLRGLPVVEGGKAKWAIPDFLPTDDRGGVFFLDEINRGTEMVANALFSLVLDGSIGDYHLPKNWVCAAAVNDKDTGARKMSSALLARFVHIDARTDLDDLCKLAIDRGWEPAVIAFVRFRPELLHKYDPKSRVSPNPRAWEFISQLVSQAPDKSVEYSLFAGAIGEGAAIEFSGFLRLFRELPSIDGLLLNPDTTDVPAQPGSRYAIAAALARRINEKTFGRALKYLERMPVEYNVLAVQDAVRRTPVVQSMPEFTRWSIAHADVTF